MKNTRNNKPQHYRNTQSSQTIAPSKVSKPIIGHFKTDENGKEVFVQTN